MSHTPGPAHHSYREWDDNDTVCSDDGACIAVRPQLLTKSLWIDTAKLLAASYTSYDKHCGENAAQCAEEDLLGQALWALHAVGRTMHYVMRHLDGAQFRSIGEAIKLCESVLAKAKGA